VARVDRSFSKVHRAVQVRPSWARWFRALGDPNRLEILRWIARHPRATVTDVVRESGLSQPLVSHHLKRLRDEGLVRKDEDKVRAGHRVDPETLAALARELSRIAAIAREEERMAADERRASAGGSGPSYAENLRTQAGSRCSDGIGAGLTWDSRWCILWIHQGELRDAS
jgi:DNA-binding transcriptional ArsR family regulator